MKSNLILNQSTKTRLEIYKKDKTFDEFLNEMMDIIDKVTPVDIIKCDKFYTNEEIKSIKDKMEENMGKPGYGIIIDDTIYSDQILFPEKLEEAKKCLSNLKCTCSINENGEWETNSDNTSEECLKDKNNYNK